MNKEKLLQTITALCIKEYMDINNISNFDSFIENNNLSPTHIASMPFLVCGATNEPEKAFRLFDWNAAKITDMRSSAIFLSIHPRGMKEFLETIFDFEPNTKNLNFTKNFMEKPLEESSELNIFRNGLDYISRVCGDKHILNRDAHSIQRILRRHSAHSALELTVFRLKYKKCSECGQKTNILAEPPLERCEVPFEFLMGRRVFAQDADHQILI